MLKVSFIITSYNNKKYIEECIKSASNNVKENIEGEIIVVDDCSTDGSYEFLNKIRNKYGIILLKTRINSGPSAARNMGLKHATGDFINFIDGDDYIMPSKIFLQIKEAKLNKRIITYTDCLVIEKKSAYLLKNSWPVKSGKIFTHLLKGSCFAIHAPLVPKDIAKSYLFDESLRQAEDYDYWLRISAKYSFKFIDKPLVAYRISDKNLTNDFKQAYFYTLKVYKKLLMKKMTAKQNKLINERIIFIKNSLVARENNSTQKGLSNLLKGMLNKQLLLLKHQVLRKRK